MKNFSAPINAIKKNDLLINSDYESFLREAQLDSFDTVWNYAAGEIVKKIKDRSVIRLSFAKNNALKYYYLKRHNTEFIGIKGILKSFFGIKNLSQGLLEFNNICEFRDKQLQTVIPVAAGEKYHHFFWVESFLVTQDAFPYVSLETLLDKNPGFFQGDEGRQRREKLIRRLSDLARKMHQKGFNHQDFNSTHILLFYHNNPDSPEIALFDLQRVEKKFSFRFRWKIKSLARLNYTLPEGIFDTQDRKNLLLFYKGKTHFNLIDRIEWYWIEKKTKRIQRHTEKRHNRPFTADING
ncbi:MAG: lipopolysaccharide kinase InaA family protein [Desulfosalsimonas sp.]|uniref:lipopolysaccharide kinase InaA family protein n=1 Tax=Desulfosalsimonas sp. TaxID=3073848 RepID=UPI003970BE65